MEDSSSPDIAMVNTSVGTGTPTVIQHNGQPGIMGGCPITTMSPLESSQLQHAIYSMAQQQGGMKTSPASHQPHMVSIIYHNPLTTKQSISFLFHFVAHQTAQ